MVDGSKAGGSHRSRSTAHWPSAEEVAQRLNNINIDESRAGSSHHTHSTAHQPSAEQLSQHFDGTVADVEAEANRAASAYGKKLQRIVERGGTLSDTYSLPTYYAATPSTHRREKEMEREREVSSGARDESGSHFLYGGAQNGSEKMRRGDGRW